MGPRSKEVTVGRVAELGRGDVVGELGLLDDAPRSATVRAVRDSTLATLTAEMFEELVIRSPALMLHVAHGVISRLRTQPRRSGRAASLTVAVTAPLDTEPLLDAIVTEIGRFGSVRHLSSERVDRILNRPDISQATADNVGVPRLSELMHEADVGNDHVVLETDPGLTGWTRRSLRQADRVLLIVSAHPGAEERAADRRARRPARRGRTRPADGGDRAPGDRRPSAHDGSSARRDRCP